jgi:CRISPR-associated protein Cmr3
MPNPLKLRIKPIDPLISRDSRPFGLGQGARIRSLDWLNPSVVCGALRSSAGKAHGSFDVPKLTSIKVRGPFLECCGSLYFPRPLDCVSDEHVAKDHPAKGYAIRPSSQKQGEGGTEMPLDLLPTFIEGLPDYDFKPARLPEFWSADAMLRWLAGEGNFSLFEDECLTGPAKDERTHVGIDLAAGTSKDSLLFSTTGLDFKVKNGFGEVLQMTAAIEAEPPDDDYERYIEEMSSLHPVGGERRLAEWSVNEGVAAGWAPPSATPKGVRLRMVLATPAIFNGGWLPGWIDKESREGNIPNTSVRVRLISAIVGRWVPIAGWSYAKPYGPKPLRRMAPSGSVYFFEAERGLTSEEWGDMWLRSVCDAKQDKNDGFGAALWGAW